MTSKFLIIGDTHIGARNASTIVMEHQIEYFEQVVFPYMEEHGITTILQLGDLFDTRKFTNHYVLSCWRSRVFDKMRDMGVTFITLLGNHDIAFKNTVAVNSTSMMLADYDNIILIDTPVDMDICGVSFALIPWICESNEEEIMEFVKASESLFCAGHFEFIGFDINPGYTATSGHDTAPFKKFDMVFSGHYHTRGSSGNILYTGIPYELTWIDYADPKGIWMFDGDDYSFEYIKNERPMFVKIVYDDLDQGEEYYKEVDVSQAERAYVKLIVTHKTDAFQFEKVVNAINAKSPIDLVIMDEVEDFSEIELDEVDVEVKDTPSLIENFVEQTSTELDKEQIVGMMKELYVEALHLQA